LRENGAAPRTRRRHPADGRASRLAAPGGRECCQRGSTRDEYEIQFTDIFDPITAYAAGGPINVLNPDVLRTR
jgi:hypothetical protein